MRNSNRSKRAVLLSLSAVLLGGLVIGVILLVMGGQPTYADAGIIYVDAAATGTATGLSWTDAFTTVQDALAVAEEGDEIWVAAGVYYPDDGAGQTQGDRTSTFQLVSGVALYGGFSGIETERDDRDWTANVTVLSGDIDGNDETDAQHVVTDTATIAGHNAYHVVTSVGLTETAVLDGFIITAGSADGPWWERQNRGAGLYSEESELTIANLIFSGNYASGRGAGIHNLESHLTLTDVTFTGNHAENRGGGMSNELSHPALTRVTFTGNEATWGGGIYNLDSEPTLVSVAFTTNRAESGGGIYNLGSNPQLEDVTFTANYAIRGGGMDNSESEPALTNVSFADNEAALNGGAMRNFQSSPTLSQVTFTGNQAGGRGGGMFSSWHCEPLMENVTFSANQAVWGGGIYNEWHITATLTDVTFDGNQATWGGGIYNDRYSSPTLIRVNLTENEATWGGGMFSYLSSPQLIDVVFSGNQASRGGGVDNYQSSPTLINVAFTGNHAESAAGMYNLESDTTLINVTFAGNHATWGGGLVNDASDPALVNCILWSNSPDNIADQNDSSPTVTYSNVGLPTGVYPGTGNINEDPLFVASVPSAEAPTTAGDYRIQATSPAVDAGLNAAVPATVTTDLDGNPRIVDGSGDGTAVVDMGAYESQVSLQRLYLPVILVNH